MLNNLEQLMAEVIDDEFEVDLVVSPGGNAVPYPQFVGTLAKEMDSFPLNVLHASVGIAGEGGEVLDIAKKGWVYNVPFDDKVREHLIEELGDLEFYMQHLRLLIGVSRQRVLDANAVKLGKRYAKGYSDAAAQARADKVEVPATPFHVIDMSSKEDPTPPQPQ